MITTTTYSKAAHRSQLDHLLILIIMDFICE